MKLKQIIKILMLILIALSAAVFTILMLFSSELIISNDNSEITTFDPPPSQESAPQQESYTNSSDKVSSRVLSNMFYISYAEKPKEQEEIIEQPDTVRYDNSRFSYLGIVSTEKNRKYLIKDNQLDFIFPIAEGETTQNLTISELNLQEQYIILSDGENLYFIKIK